MRQVPSQWDYQRAWALTAKSLPTTDDKTCGDLTGYSLSPPSLCLNMTRLSKSWPRIALHAWSPLVHRRKVDTWSTRSSFLHTRLLTYGEASLTSARRVRSSEGMWWTILLLTCIAGPAVGNDPVWLAYESYSKAEAQVALHSSSQTSQIAGELPKIAWTGEGVIPYKGSVTANRGDTAV